MIRMELMGILQPIVVKKGSWNLHLIAMKDSTQCKAYQAAE